MRIKIITVLLVAAIEAPQVNIYIFLLSFYLSDNISKISNSIFLFSFFNLLIRRPIINELVNAKNALIIAMKKVIVNIVINKITTYFYSQFYIL